MTTTLPAPEKQRAPGPRQEQEIMTRLRKATGQLNGITGMYEDGRYCIDILDQLARCQCRFGCRCLAGTQRPHQHLRPRGHRLRRRWSAN
jgi:hypothetical protein